MPEPWLVRVVVPGAPFGKQRAKGRNRGKFVQMYTPEETVNYEAKVSMAGAAAMGDRPPLDEALSVVLVAFTAIPPSWSKRKQAQAAAGDIRPTGKPDLDNLQKAVFDGFNKIVWRDDSVIARVLADKWYGLQPRVVIEVSPAINDLLT